MEQTSLQPTLLKDYTPSAFNIPKVDLEISIEKDFTEVRTKLYVEKTSEAVGTSDLCLNGEQLELIALKKNGSIVEKNGYRLNKYSLIVINPGDSFTIETTYSSREKLSTNGTVRIKVWILYSM